MVTAALILAAGLSTRMGAFKPLLPVGGTTAIRRTVAAALQGADSVAVVTGHRHAALAEELRGTGASLVYNERYRDGMFSSLRAGLAALPAETDAFFLLPADCCAVAPATLGMLRAAYRGEILYPVCDGRRGHPPLIPARHIPGLLAYNGEDGARGYFLRFSFDAAETRDPGVLLDMDTPEDYAAILRYLSPEVGNLHK
ncbi:MAG: nucleotidyltransferase family protein [Oscillospiraceae bacterium]|jgi:CTP:molybdopterin cytidylyltransferase MocA|nr:nucleotidyltransferase family protein [Oscillospiraceae bacterium]